MAIFTVTERPISALVRLHRTDAKPIDIANQLWAPSKKMLNEVIQMSGLIVMLVTLHPRSVVKGRNIR